ncbi:MAG: tetratricopeptide repeat protein [Chloroflexota bacterium]
MKSNIPRKVRKSSNSSKVVVGNVLIRWLIPLTVVLATWVAFLPVLSNDFVEWDDFENLVSNRNFRGLSRSHLGWMFTTFHMGPYQPLSWLTLGLDYSVWGMNPTGYHLTNLLLHSANAVACYFVSRRLLFLALAESDREKPWPVNFSAAFAALFFALHPLRVESVAWATERRDVLSGLFYLGTIYAYLRANDELIDRDRSRRWMITALAFYLLSLLSKATAMTLPVVLFLLDIYPLRRLTWNFRQWVAPASRSLWREKIPFVVVAAVFAALAIMGQQQASAFKSLQSYGIGQRLAQVFFAMGFYVWKTIIPVGLSPLYQIPANFGSWYLGSLIGGVFAAAISIGLFRIKDRWPAGLTCWLYYLVVLAPTSGLVPTGPQLAADRYSYLSCLGWAVLAGGALLFVLRRYQQPHRAFPAAATFAVALVIVAVLGAFTWQQSAIWRNTETLWRRVLEIDPNSSFAHYNLARYIARQGRYQEAITHYREALRIHPDDPDTHNNLGLMLASTGQVESSLAEFRRAIEIDRRYAKGYFNLGRVLSQQGDLGRAADNLRKAIQLDPNQAEIHLALAAVLARQGRVEEAEAQLEEVVRLKPESADARVALARWLASQGKTEEAERHYQEALRLMKSQAQNTPRSGDDSGTHEFPAAVDSVESPVK